MHPGVGLALPIALALLLACAPPVPRPARVVLVTVDTLRADRVGCYGAPGAHTPHLDAIARDGVRFAVALSPAPLTLPAHASLMTALDPPGHGVRHNSIHRLGDDIPTLAEQMRGAGYATAAFVGAVVLDRRFGLDRGFDHYDDRTGGRDPGPAWVAERPADAVVDAALGWLERAPERFFLWVHLYDPHLAHRPPPGFASAFPSDPYAGEIAFADAELGRLLAGIRERFGADGLVLVATSDHGESLGEHGELTHSYSLYGATQRVPLLLSGPGLPAGSVVETPVGLVDVAPTLLAWVGADPLPGGVGRDLRRVVAGGEDPRALYMETLATRFDFGWSPLLGLRTERFTYIRAPRPELYDLAADPGETRNLAAVEPARVAELDAALERRRAAPRPSAPVELDEQERHALRSLGYLVPQPDGAAAGALGEVGGPDPKDGTPLLQALSLAQADLHEGRHAEALARLDALGEAGPTVSAYRAAAALSAGAPQRAELEARAVLEVSPARLDMRVLLARALAAQGREAEADAILADLPPQLSPAAWVSLAAARGDLAAGRRERAALRLSRARERHPGDASLARAHAGLLEAEARHEEALAAREEVLRLQPDDVAARNEVARALARLGRDLERALALVEAALASGGERPELLDTLATVQLARGEADAALAAARRGLPEASGATREHLLELEAAARRDGGATSRP